MRTFCLGWGTGNPERRCWGAQAAALPCCGAGRRYGGRCGQRWGSGARSGDSFGGYSGEGAGEGGGEKAPSGTQSTTPLPGSSRSVEFSFSVTLKLLAPRASSRVIPEAPVSIFAVTITMRPGAWERISCAPTSGAHRPGSPNLSSGICIMRESVEPSMRVPT